MSRVTALSLAGRTVALGSHNPAKRAALVAALEPHGAPRIEARDVDSGVRAQPIGLPETVAGATARARAALAAVDGARLGFGLEDGVLPLLGAGDRALNVCAAVITDGARVLHGLGAAFEYPPEIARAVLEEGLDVSAALRATGWTQDARVGAGEGAIGRFTAGAWTRAEYAQDAFRAALVHAARVFGG